MTTEISAERKIRNALVNLLEEKSFHKISVTDITKSADINRSTYYYHYYDIEEVLDKVIKVAVEDLIKKLLQSMPESETFTIDSTVLTPTKVMFDHIYEYKRYYSALIKSDVSHRFVNTFIESLFNLNSNLKVTFNHSSKHIIDQEMHANLYSHAAFGQVKYWIDHDFEQSSEYMAKQLTSSLFMEVDSIAYKK